METAREVIRGGRLSAYAQLCELPEEQRANYQTLMRREEAKSKWTDQQMLFINQLHLFTVMTLTGKVQLVEKDGDKQVVVQEGKPAKTETCTDTERKKVQEQIMAFVERQAPPPPRLPPQPPSAPSRPRPARRSRRSARQLWPHGADAAARRDRCAIDAARLCAITRSRAGRWARISLAHLWCPMPRIGEPVGPAARAPGRGGSARQLTLAISPATLECHA